MPEFAKFGEDNKDTVQFLGINMGDETPEVQNTMNEFKINYPITIDNTGDLVFRYRVRGHPTTLVVSKAGILTAVIAGYFEPASLKAEVEKASR